MFKKIVFSSLFVFTFLVTLQQDVNAKTWQPYSKIQVDSILAAINRGDSILIDSCEIFGSLIKVGAIEKPDTIKNFIRIVNTTFHDTVLFFGCCFLNDIYLDSCIFFK